MAPSARAPWWQRPALTPWLVLPLFLPDALLHPFTPSHWALLLAAAAGLGLLGHALERGGFAGQPQALLEGPRPIPAAAVLAVVAAWLAAAWALSVLSFHGFNTRYLAQDSAYFNQMMWNTVDSRGGRWLEGSMFQETMYTPPVRNHFGVHVSPFLLLLAPLYALAPHLYLLLLLRNLALGLGAWLLFRELRGPLGSAGALLAAAAWLLHPNTLVAATGELNEMAFAAPGVFAVVGAAARGRLREGALAAAGLALVREDAVLPAAAAALLAALRWRRPAWGLLAVACLAWFLACYRWVLPAFGASGGKLVAEVYQEVGGGPAGIVRTLLTRPQVVVGMFGDPARLLYLATLLRSFVGLPLFSWAALCAGPTLLSVLLVPLALYGDVVELWRHYSTLSVAVLALAGGLGAAFWVRRAAQASRPRIALVLGLALLSACLYTQIQTQGIGWLKRARPSPLAPVYRELLAAVPPGAAVAAPYPMTPALSQRRYVYALRFRERPSDRDEDAIRGRCAFVIADLDSARARTVHAAGPGYAAFLRRLLEDPEWVPVMERQGLVLLAHRGRAGSLGIGRSSAP
jgi:uncharacterized membrane protein